jgi:hypothetical protein
MQRRLLRITPIFLIVLLSCTSGSDNEGLVVDPPEPAVRVGEQLTLTAQPLEDLSQEPEWEIKEPYGGGFLNTQGLRTTYVAPVSAGRYTIIVRSVRADGSRVKTSRIIHVLPIVQVEPSQIHLSSGASTVFTVRIKGITRNSVHWSVEESDGGSISAEGLYQAPGQSGTFHVVATSAADPDVRAIAVVQVD